MPEKWGFRPHHAVHIAALSRLFHVSANYILGTESKLSLSVEGYTEEEVALLYSLIQCDTQH